jgi:hypothetical protein
MNFNGRIVHCTAAEQRITVGGAVVTADRLSLDWNQDGRTGYLIAKSTNGNHFQGRYGYRQEKSEYDCELTLFQAKHEDLLYGTWRERNSDRQGSLVIRLPARTIEASPPAAADAPWEEATAEPQTAAEPSAAAVRVPAVAVSAAKVAVMPAAKVAVTPTPAPVNPAPPVRSVSPTRPIVVSLSSTQVDHLLSITAEQFAERDRQQIEQELLAAPVSALFKLAHNAAATDLRALAAKMFADRYGAAPVSNSPVRTPRATESPEMRAQKRRSSKHRTR